MEQIVINWCEPAKDNLFFAKHRKKSVFCKDLKIIRFKKINLHSALEQVKHS